MSGIDRSELEAQVRRWFPGADTSAAGIDALLGKWQQHEGDRAHQAMLERQFDPANRAVFGTAWWEERQKGRSGVVLPIAAVDRLVMWMHYDPLTGLPAARPYCPDQLLGQWHLAGTGRSADALQPPASPRLWTLHADGRLEAVGDPARQGWTWRAHRGRTLDLWLYAPGERTPNIWPALRIERGEMDLYPPQGAPRFQRWRRTP